MGAKGVSMIECMKDETSFQIRLNGYNSIDVDILCNVLKSTQEALKHSKPKQDSDTHYTLVLTAIKPGSIDIYVKAIVEVLPDLFTVAIPVAASLVSIFVGAIELKKYLRGNKPKSAEEKDGTVELVNSEDEKKSIDSTYYQAYIGNIEMDNCIVNFFNSVEKAGGVQSVDIIRDTGETVTVSRSDFRYQQTPIVQEIQDTKEKDVRTNILRDFVRIRKPDLLGHTKWSVYYKENQKEISIKDDEFLHDLAEQKYSFCAGTSLLVDMAISTIYIKETLEFVSESYEILKVIEVIQPKMTQTTIV